MVIVDSSFVYPQIKSVNEKELKEAQIQLSYTCIDGTCNFSDALTSIQKNNEAAELKALGVNQLTKVIVDLIDKNPDVFPSQGLGGYIFQSTGRSFLLLNNATPPEGDARLGLVDLTQVRKKLYFESLRVREQNQVWTLNLIAAAAVVSSLTFALKLMRHGK